jgi:hypothetical protein
VQSIQDEDTLQGYALSICQLCCVVTVDINTALLLIVKVILYFWAEHGYIHGQHRKSAPGQDCAELKDEESNV